MVLRHELKERVEADQTGEGCVAAGRLGLRLIDQVSEEREAVLPKGWCEYKWSGRRGLEVVIVQRHPQGERRSGDEKGRVYSSPETPSSPAGSLFLKRTAKWCRPE